jgi:hypothetical protein
VLSTEDSTWKPKNLQEFRDFYGSNKGMEDSGRQIAVVGGQFGVHLIGAVKVNELPYWASGISKYTWAASLTGPLWGLGSQMDIRPRPPVLDLAVLGR